MKSYLSILFLFCSMSLSSQDKKDAMSMIPIFLSTYSEELDQHQKDDRGNNYIAFSSYETNRVARTRVGSFVQKIDINGIKLWGDDGVKLPIDNVDFQNNNDIDLKIDARGGVYCLIEYFQKTQIIHIDTFGQIDFNQFLNMHLLGNEIFIYSGGFAFIKEYLLDSTGASSVYLFQNKGDTMLSYKLPYGYIDNVERLYMNYPSFANRSAQDSPQKRRIRKATDRKIEMLHTYISRSKGAFLYSSSKNQFLVKIMEMDTTKTKLLFIQKNLEGAYTSEIIQMDREGRVEIVSQKQKILGLDNSKWKYIDGVYSDENKGFLLELTAKGSMNRTISDICLVYVSSVDENPWANCKWLIINEIERYISCEMESDSLQEFHFEMKEVEKFKKLTLFPNNKWSITSLDKNFKQASNTSSWSVVVVDNSEYCNEVFDLYISKNNVQKNKHQEINKERREQPYKLDTVKRAFLEIPVEVIKKKPVEASDLALMNTEYNEHLKDIALDGIGGIVYQYSLSCNFFNGKHFTRTYLQRIDSLGNRLWGKYGLDFSFWGAQKFYSDNHGGVYVDAYRDSAFLIHYDAIGQETFRISYTAVDVDEYMEENQQIVDKYGIYYFYFKDSLYHVDRLGNRGSFYIGKQQKRDFLPELKIDDNQNLYTYRLKKKRGYYCVDLWKMDVEKNLICIAENLKISKDRPYHLEFRFYENGNFVGLWHKGSSIFYHFVELFNEDATNIQYWDKNIQSKWKKAQVLNVGIESHLRSSTCLLMMSNEDCYLNLFNYDTKEEYYFPLDEELNLSNPIKIQRVGFMGKNDGILDTKTLKYYNIFEHDNKNECYEDKDYYIKIERVKL